MTTNSAISASQHTRVIRTVLMVDLVESVRLMEEDEDDTVHRWLRLVNQIEGMVLPAHQGRLVKSLGDGLLLEFSSVRPALQAAFAIQKVSAESNIDVATNRQMHLRMGAQVGELVADARDVYGHDVNVAARLTTLAGPGEIVVSVDVRDQLTPVLDADIEDLGERRLKNVARPVRAFVARPPGFTADHARIPKARMGDRPSIAVMPFHNVFGDVQHEYLGDVIADEVIGHLSRVADLTVISRLSTTPFRDRTYEPKNVAEKLGVRYLVTGKMQFSGTSLRLTAELVEADAGRVVWTNRFDGSIDNLFELQDKMSLDIAKRIVPSVRELELSRARAQSPEHLTAYERTLKAINLLHHCSPQDLELAQQELEAAIQSDPSFVAPYAWLARLYVLRQGQGSPETKESDTKNANKFARIALEKDSTDPWALSVYGLVASYLNKDLETGIDHLEKALSKNPSAPSAWLWSTSAYAWMGQGDEAVKRSHRAIELSPFDPHMYQFTSIAGTAHAVAGQYDKAIDYCKLSLRENRMFTSSHRILTVSLALAGRVDEAESAANDLLKVEPSMTVSGFRNRYPGNKDKHADLFCEALATAGVPR